MGPRSAYRQSRSRSPQRSNDFYQRGGHYPAPPRSSSPNNPPSFVSRCQKVFNNIIRKIPTSSVKLGDLRDEIVARERRHVDQLAEKEEAVYLAIIQQVRLEDVAQKEKAQRERADDEALKLRTMVEEQVRASEEEKTGLKRKKEGLEGALRREEDLLEESAEKIKGMEEQIVASTKEINAISIVLATQERKITDMAEDKKEATAAHLNTIASRNKLAEKVDSLVAQKDDLTKQLESAKSTLKAAEGKFVTVQQTIDTMTTEHEAVRTTLQAFKRKWDEVGERFKDTPEPLGAEILGHGSPKRIRTCEDGEESADTELEGIVVDNGNETWIEVAREVKAHTRRYRKRVSK